MASEAEDLKVLRLNPSHSGAPTGGGPTKRTEFERKYATQDLLVQGETPMPFRPARRPVPEYYTQLTDPMNPRNRGSLKARTDTDSMRKDATYAGKRSNPGATAEHFRERNQNSES